MKKLNFALIFVLLIAMCLTFVGCGGRVPEGAYKVYYLDTDKTSLYAVNFDYSSQVVNERLDEAFSRLSKDSTNVEYMRTIPSGVELESYELDNGVLSVFFGRDYYNIDKLTEILIRAAIVKTVTQIDEVESVAFYVENMPLQNANGEAIGLMTADMFIDDFGQETESLLCSDLTLYFSSADGASLIAENRQVYYSRNVAVERLVIDQLMKGPTNKRALRVIANETKVISVSVTDGICYVNFDSAFENAITGVTEKVTIYSIVNSLTELPNINKVQVLVNGETLKHSNLDVDLNNPISRDTQMVISDYAIDDSFITEGLDVIDSEWEMEIMPDSIPEDSDQVLPELVPADGEEEVTEDTEATSGLRAGVAETVTGTNKTE